MGIESVKRLQARVEQAIRAFRDEGETVAIIGKGRNIGEQSLVLVEQGAYVGFGFFDREASIQRLRIGKELYKAKC